MCPLFTAPLFGSWLWLWRGSARRKATPWCFDVVLVGALTGVDARMRVLSVRLCVCVLSLQLRRREAYPPLAMENEGEQKTTDGENGEETAKNIGSRCL